MSGRRLRLRVRDYAWSSGKLVKRGEHKEREREIRKSKLNRASLAISGGTLGEIRLARYWKQSSPHSSSHVRPPPQSVKVVTTVKGK